MNQRLLLERLARVGTASRAELADGTGMSRPTAGKIIDELLSAEVLDERETADGEGPRRLGRPGRLLSFASRTPRFVLVQLGVRRTDLVAAPLVGADDENAQVSFATPRSAETWLARVRAARAELQPGGGLWGFAVGLPGAIDERAGRCLYSPNLHWLEKVDLLGALGDIFGVPGFLLQEIRALALGHMNTERAHTDFFLVDAEDGVGGAAMIAGQLYTGPHPSAGELGHTPVLGNARRCGCGAVGCLETLIARPGLAASFVERSRRRTGGTPGDTWEALRDHLAREPLPAWLGRSLDAAAAVIAGALNVFGLRRVVVTGALNELSPEAFAHLAAGIRHGALPARFGELDVRAAPRHRWKGLAAAAVDRLLIPTASWQSPCVPI